MPELKSNKIVTKKYNYKNIDFIEKIEKDELAMINFESKESYPLFISSIDAGGNKYKIVINFDQGRKTANFLHTIISVDERRVSLGFTNNILEVRNLINSYIHRHVNLS